MSGSCPKTNKRTLASSNDRSRERYPSTRLIRRIHYQDLRTPSLHSPDKEKTI